ncbi:DNA-binding transcriptional MerR regulator [Hydrogenoanaerobacterium saccharovorans]|uniref:DNA-binding transcriptional regulator, MerR family n=1 Tax=Hydrogenoanaerobacterium saccharovorans TaxID=474960 RepID=A0A1H8ARZ8_9FIRM|nr:MerR family transcriptional regulator [Hydrogenoanaerobacterium saccharovorans]RPF47821.1 DNA-binding transcriptional MerR regulator [Hydrogenoanaerobacterium saccharovorans]SEM72589.1 DNA-binding transcriptional regulator, MerR family [Hydrogenoanaerobacterium saccharovorans]
MKVGDTIETTYTTSQVAKKVRVHPNTVRKYEDLGFISKPIRKENGYRVFTDLHLEQFKLARIAFQIEVLQNGLRKKAVSIVKLSALCEFDKAIGLTENYIFSIETEIENANEAVKMVKELLRGGNRKNSNTLKRKEVSDMLGITMDTLRNWEMNGLFKVKRRENGYRIYTDEDIRKLKIIRSLKCANYSLSAILRMMNALDKNAGVDINNVLNNPNPNEDIISVCDRLILSLGAAKQNAVAIKSMLFKMKSKYSNPPL